MEAENTLEGFVRWLRADLGACEPEQSSYLVWVLIAP